jgi:serine/threonine protein kinase
VLASGQTLHQRYYIHRLLGQGGMGAVYLAQDLQQGGGWVAVKEMIPDPNANLHALAQARMQFQREAQVLMGLRHANLPQVYETFSEGGNEYLVMQYVEGRNLLEIAAADWGQGRSLGESRVLGWAMQIIDALEYLHGQRPYPVLHRDVKPQNIILTPGGELYLVDFGLVKLLDPNNPQTMTALRGLGTPQYAPPEQYATGSTHTAPYSDVYALGATLYHLLTGQAPPSATERLLPAPMTKPLVPLCQLNPSISPPMEQALLKALALAPADRFASAGEMRRALLGQTPQKKAPVWAVAGAAVTLLLLVVAVLILVARPRPATPTPAPLAVAPTPTFTHTPSLISTDTPVPPTPTGTPNVGATETALAALILEGVSGTQTAESQKWTPMPTDTPTPTLTPTHTPTQKPTPTWTPTPTIPPAPLDGRDLGDSMDWVFIVGGNFTMGSSQADIQAAMADCNLYEGNCQASWFGSESPQRTEWTEAFEISKYEVTNAQYNLCVQNGPCLPARKASSDGSIDYDASYFADNYPVVTVTGNDASIFCDWIGGRLPNEREWEKAARGTDGRRYPWGNTLDMSRANLYSGRPTNVGSYSSGASPYGVMDMAGNVAEFTSDHVVRGGSWKSYPHHGRTTQRSTGPWLTRDFANFDVGFRCVR